MRLLCPNCRQNLNLKSLVCPRGHRFECQGGVLVLLEETFRGRLQRFTNNIQRFRAGNKRRLLDPSLYEDLPFAEAVQADGEWRWRGHDVTNITGLLADRQGQTILDIGAGNGWLSHRLARQGHQVTAIDYFADAYDGLGAKMFYSTTWQAIQMDLTDLSILDQLYDVVIINHGLQFFPDPLSHVAAAGQKMKQGGLLLLIGLQFFRDPAARIKKVANLQQAYKANYGADMFLWPTKGYLDFSDKARLKSQGIHLKPYRQLWLRNLKASLSQTEPKYYYGLSTG